MATTFYFPTTTAAPVTPSYHANWQYTTEVLRRRLGYPKGSSTQTTGSQIGPWTDTNLALDRQYVSAPMAAGIVFNSSVTIRGQLRVREFNTGDNANRIILSIAIWDITGTVSRRVLLAPAAYGTTLEFVNSTSLANRIMANDDALAPSSSYTTIDGDRLVVEIGYTNATGTTPEASASWGESQTDLTYNNTTETTGSGWIRFSNDIIFRTQSFAAELTTTENFGAAASVSRKIEAAHTATADLAVNASIYNLVGKGYSWEPHGRFRAQRIGGQRLILSEGKVSFAASLVVTEAFDAAFSIERGMAASSVATSNHAVKLSCIRPIAANLTATSDFAVITKRSCKAAANLTVTSNLAIALARVRSISADLIVTSNFAVNVKRNCNAAANLTVTSNVAAVFVRVRRVAANLTTTSNFAVIINRKCKTAANLTTTSNFAIVLARSRLVAADLSVMSNMAVAISKYYELNQPYIVGFSIFRSVS